MKLGLISDIHADLKALECALEILAREGVEKIVCCGDLVARGADGDAVVHLIQDRSIPCVMGNHDYETAKIVQPLMRETTNMNVPEDVARLLNQETLDYLLQLPETFTFTHNWMRIVVAHGTPDSKDEYLFSQSPSIKFRMIADKTEADVILLGHTHEPMQVKLRTLGKWFFNPGSVYTDERRRGSYTCAMLTLPQCTFEVFSLVNGEPIDVPLVKI
jgi:putative phosphoesterase